MGRRTNVEHGGRVVFFLGNRRVALADSIEITERTPLESVEPLGSLHAFEHIRVSYQVEGSFSMYRAYEASIKASGWMPQTTHPREILEHEAVFGEVRDLLGPGSIEKIQGITIEECSRGYRKGQLTMYNCRWRGILVKDESS